MEEVAIPVEVYTGTGAQLFDFLATTLKAFIMGHRGSGKCVHRWWCSGQGWNAAHSGKCCPGRLAARAPLVCAWALAGRGASLARSLCDWAAHASWMMDGRGHHNTTCPALGSARRGTSAEAPVVGFCFRCAPWPHSHRMCSPWLPRPSSNSSKPA